MATKAKPKKALKAFNQFQEKLHKYLELGNDTDFMRALQVLITAPITSKYQTTEGTFKAEDKKRKAALKQFAKENNLSSENLERLMEMRALWNVVQNNKAVVKNSELGLSIAHLEEAAKLAPFNVFRLLARNLDLIPKVKSGHPNYDRQQDFFTVIDEVKAKNKALDDLKMVRLLSAGMIDVCKDNPRMNLEEAEKAIAVFRKYANKSHPNKTDARKKFYGKLGSSFADISDAQFNRAWNQGQVYLQDVARTVLYPSGIILSGIEKDLRAAATRLLNEKGEAKYLDHARFEEAVEAIRRLDGKHLKGLLGPDGKNIRRELENNLKEINNARNMAKKDPSLEQAAKIISAAIEGLQEIGGEHNQKGLENARKLVTNDDKKLSADISKSYEELSGLATKAKEIQAKGKDLTNADLEDLKKLHQQAENKLETIVTLEDRLDAKLKASPTPPKPATKPVKAATPVTPTAAAATPSPTAATPPTPPKAPIPAPSKYADKAKLEELTAKRAAVAEKRDNAYKSHSKTVYVPSTKKPASSKPTRGFDDFEEIKEVDAQIKQIRQKLANYKGSMGDHFPKINAEAIVKLEQRLKATQEPGFSESLIPRNRDAILNDYKKMLEEVEKVRLDMNVALAAKPASSQPFNDNVPPPSSPPPPPPSADPPIPPVAPTTASNTGTLPSSSPSSTASKPGTDDLLAAIRKGTTLRKADTSKTATPTEVTNDATTATPELGDILKKVLVERREDIAGEVTLPAFEEAKDRLWDDNPYKILNIESTALDNKTEKEKDEVIKNAFNEAMKSVDPNTDKEALLKAAFVFIKSEDVRKQHEHEPPSSSMKLGSRT